MTFGRRPMPQRREREPDEFKSFKMPTRQGIHALVSTEHPTLPASHKVGRAARTIKPLREAAKGEHCTMQLPGCRGGTEHTIASHARWAEAGKGGAIKAVDIAIAFACTHCDAVFDGQTPRPTGWTQEMVDKRWHMGHLMTLVRIVAKGLL